MTTDTLRPATGAISEAEIEAVAAELAFKSYLRTGCEWVVPPLSTCRLTGKPCFLNYGWGGEQTREAC